MNHKLLKMESELIELAKKLGHVLADRGLTLATAESCTGGLVGALLTEIPGSSTYYQGGVIAYSNFYKMKILGVNPLTLERYGAVSHPTAREMALGVWGLGGAKLALSITGTAGPAGGTAIKPVGTVFFGFIGVDGQVDSVHKLFNGDRQAIRLASAKFALESMLERV